MPQGLEDVSGYPALLGELLDRGWSEDDCARLAGGNVLRAMQDAAAIAGHLRNERPASLARIEDLDG